MDNFRSTFDQFRNKCMVLSKLSKKNANKFLRAARKHHSSNSEEECTFQNTKDEVRSYLKHLKSKNHRSLRRNRV